MTKSIKIFSENIEGLALHQFHEAMKCDFAIQGALMPDAHAGYALPIGAVVAAKDVIVPAWIGYDIGCGMCAVPTSFDKDEVIANSKAIFDQIYRDVPVGFNHNKTSANWKYEGEFSHFAQSLITEGSALKQLGSLGSGNHFIEVGYDERDMVWVVIHSGSRNVGHKIATNYMKLASDYDLLAQGKEPTNKAREGHFPLHVECPEGMAYIADMNFALEFALENRKRLVMKTVDAIARKVKGNAAYHELINRNHNHAELKYINYGITRDMKPVWIHRKGATHAEKGMMGVVPGNMRDGSFIVRGKGNPDSMSSSSHGAGRVMSRSQAKATLNLDDFKQTMSDCNVMAKVDAGTLDEAPFAYKDIFTVMSEQSDLVEVVQHIKPIINIKG